MTSYVVKTVEINVDAFNMLLNLLKTGLASRYRADAVMHSVPRDVPLIEEEPAF